MKKLTLFFGFLLAFQGLSAQNYQLHSVFMYSFARYIQWPDATTKEVFTITVLGDSPILAELQLLAGKKKIGERTIVVSQAGSVSEIKQCNILFVSATHSANLAEILTKLANEPTLVVTEQAGLGVKGSNINFIHKDGKLAFELNTTSLTRRKLKPSTELTRIAILI